MIDLHNEGRAAVQHIRQPSVITDCLDISYLISYGENLFSMEDQLFSTLEQLFSIEEQLFSMLEQLFSME
jgi:hypothetical protein